MIFVFSHCVLPTEGVLVVVLHTADDLNMRGKERERGKGRGRGEGEKGRRGGGRKGRRGGGRRVRQGKERGRDPTTVPELTELEMRRE